MLLGIADEVIKQASAMSAFGTFETCPPILRMSVHGVPG
jgi:hypothetical protein